VTKPGGFFKSQRCRSEGKAINYLVAATVERHDRNSGRRPIESGPFPFILRTHLVYDVSINLEASEHDDVGQFPVTSDEPTSGGSRLSEDLIRGMDSS